MDGSKLKIALFLNERSKSKYDDLVLCIPLSSLNHIYLAENKNYGSCNAKPMADLFIEAFNNQEPLINKMSKTCINKLKSSVLMGFQGKNFTLLDHGGDGMIAPTFIEILHDFTFSVKSLKKVVLENDYDKQFYAKYFWAFEQYSQIIYECSNKNVG